MRSFAFVAPTGRLYVVRGGSMAPSFQPGELLLVDRAAYRGSSPVRGDVVIACDPRDPSVRHLKRTVGLPGEQVRLAEGMLYVDGVHLPEPYLAGLPASPGLVDQTWKLGDDEYFLMGDNRARSTDSRELGPVPARLIVGRAWFRCWPLSRWGGVGGR